MSGPIYPNNFNSPNNPNNRPPENAQPPFYHHTPQSPQPSPEQTAMPPGGAPYPQQPVVGASAVPQRAASMPLRRQTPPLRNNRRFILTLVLIALVFVLLVGGLLFAGYQTAQAELQPALAAQSFCDDLQAHNYTAAYALLSSGYQSTVTRDQYIQSNMLQDQVDGKIKGCPTASGNVIDLSFSAPKDHVAFLVTILRNKSFSGHIALVQQGGAWKVDAVEQSLAGTNLGPLLVANTFCSAISKGDYAAAYATLSSRQQSLATEQQFAQQFGAAFGGPVKLGSCTMNYATYAVQATAASVTTTLNLTIASQTTKLSTTFTFRLENGQWKLDEFTPQTPAS